MLSFAQTRVTMASPWSQARGGPRQRVPGGRATARKYDVGPSSDGLKGAGCNVSWVADEGGDLGGLILGY